MRHRERGASVLAVSLLACGAILLAACAGGGATVKYPAGTSAPGATFDFDQEESGTTPGSAMIFYILRANALEGNVNFYRYVGGQRSEIKGGSAQVSAGRWHELRAEARGKHLRGFLDGRLVVEADDDTFPAGRDGLWTKADSVACFDDFKIEPD